MHRISIILSALATGTVGFLANASAAFAMRVQPIVDGGPRTHAKVPVALTPHAGLATWEIALMVVAAVFVVALAGIATSRTLRRRVPRPAVQ